jgi:Fur family ferric uptake transcriptional regulator
MERATRQRAAIAAALRAARRPLSPGEIHSASRAAVPKLGTATVYRALRAMVEDGIIVPVHLAGEPPRYEIAHLGHHHHFRCRACERVFEVEGCPGDLSGLAPKGFQVEAHDVVLFGRCAGCTSAST